MREIAFFFKKMPERLRMCEKITTFAPAKVFLHGSKTQQG